MNTVGIVAEYNPFHTGHAYQIRQTRAELGPESAVVAVMSGNWVQQANCAVADKWIRARLALMGGADLVLELPTVWAAASAEAFARGAVRILEATGVVDVLSFGSECGDVDQLRQVAACLDSTVYQAGLARFLGEGMTFASCRQAAVRGILGKELSELLSAPNNNLGIEYIRALNALDSKIRPMTILRQGAGHNTLSTPDPPPRFVSATQIRADLELGNWEKAQPYLIPGGQAVLKAAGQPPSLARAERAILRKLRTMTVQDWARLPDSGEMEGLPQRLERAGRQCASLEGFFELAKTKRYTHARLRRLVLWAFLGLGQTDRPEHPPYLRVLGFNTKGRELLKEMKKRASLPILTKPAYARELETGVRRLFELEARCTDLYDLCLEHIPEPGREWRAGPVILGTDGEERRQQDERF